MATNHPRVRGTASLRYDLRELLTPRLRTLVRAAGLEPAVKWIFALFDPSSGHYTENMNYVILTCSRCSVNFSRTVSTYNRSLKHNPDIPPFCSHQCRMGGGRTIPCVQCGIDTLNPRFCSRACAATYNNHHMPKRKKDQKFCGRCGRPSKQKCTTCRICRPLIDHDARTLSELKNVVGSRNSYSTIVHQHGRAIAENAGLLEACAVCGYSTWVDCCHINPVAKFPVTATLGEINDKRNLVGLCKNHHWELDHGFLMLVPGVGFQPTASVL